MILIKKACEYFPVFVFHTFSLPCRLFHNGEPFAKATLPQAHRVCGRCDQNFWQLPLLQPQWHALLSVCRGAWRLLCTEAEMFQSEQVRFNCTLQAFKVSLSWSMLMFVCLMPRPHLPYSFCHVSFIRSFSWFVHFERLIFTFLFLLVPLACVL